jgi:hypothetical protein
MGLYTQTFDKIEELVRADSRLGFAEMNAILDMLDDYPRNFSILEGLCNRLYGVKIG